MVSFNLLISRVDVDFYQEILGQSQLKLLNLLEGRELRSSVLRQLLLDLYSPEELFSNIIYRKRLFEYLKEEEAKQLCEILALKVIRENYYEALFKIRYNKGSNKESILFDYFGIEKSLINNKEELVSCKKIKPSYSLFKHQIDVCNKVERVFETDLPRCILHMPTGSGKTRTAMNLISQHLRETNDLVIWLVYSSELCEQAMEEFTKAWLCLGNRSVPVYKFWGKYENNIDCIDKGFIIAGFDKMYNAYKRDFNDVLKMGEKTSLLIIDEAHQSIAPTYKTVIDCLTINLKTKILGLTATPGRTSSDIDEDLKLSSYFSKQKVSLEIDGYRNPVEYLIEKEYLARAEFSKLFYDDKIELSAKEIEALKNSLDISQDLLNRIALNEKRNLKILFVIDKLINEGHKRIILFGTTVRHAKEISSILNIRGVRSRCVTSETDINNRQQILDEYKNDSENVYVLCNYGVLTTGFDAPRTSAAIIARPTKSLVLYSQMVGRAIRGVKAGGNKVAKIITTVDIDLPGFNSVEQAFTNWEDVYIQKEEF